MRGALVTLVVGAWLTFAGAAWAYLPFVRTAADATLSPAAFGRALAGAANEFGGSAKIVNVHCVEAAPNRYMCSYALLRRTRRECHLMQGRWSPSTAAIVVTLAGRTARCTTLRAAIQSLR